MGLESVEMVMAFEAEFEIRIPEKDSEQMLTPRLTADGIVKLLRIENRHIEREKIEESIRRITIEVLCIDDGIYDLDANYVKDLGLT